MRIIIEIDYNVLNEKRFRVWKQPDRHSNLNAEEFCKFCATKEEAIEIATQLVSQIAAAHYSHEAEEAYKNLIEPNLIAS